MKVGWINCCSVVASKSASCSAPTPAFAGGSTPRFFNAAVKPSRLASSRSAISG